MAAVWTDEQDALMVKCLAEGMSRAEAGAEVNKQFNTKYSRNAAIGRAWRKGLRSTLKPGRNKSQRYPPSPQCVAAAAAKRRQAHPAPIHQKALPMPQFNRDGFHGLRCDEVEPLNVPLIELQDSHCRWPVSKHPAAALFCGHFKIEGSSYCLDHYALSVGRGTDSERRAHRVSDVA